MRIGVVVPTYNRESLVLETLESLAAQTRPPERVVIADDCSADGTVERVREWTERQSGATAWQVVRREENGGVSAARNSGAAHTTDCDFVSFLDSDDLWPVDLLERVAQDAEKNPGAVAFVCDRVVEDSTRDREPWTEDFSWIVARTVARLIRRGCPGPSCFLIRRPAFDAIGGWNETLRYMEDFDALARLSLVGPLAHVNGPLVRYRLGIGAKRGEAGALSQAFADRGLHRALAVEQFVSAHDYPGLAYERAFAWYRAGRTAYRDGNWTECEKRTLRALRIAPWYLRPAVLWLRARIRRIFRAQSGPAPTT